MIEKIHTGKLIQQKMEERERKAGYFEYVNEQISINT